MSRKPLETSPGNIYVYNCDLCNCDKNFYRECEYCEKDVCEKCCEYIKKDLFWHNSSNSCFVCDDCLARFNERYKKTTTHMNKAIKEFELEFREDRNAKS